VTPRQRTLVVGVALFATYAITAQIGLRMAFVAEQVSTVWPPSGIAIAGLLLFGRRFWPAVWLGAFVANATTSAPVWTAAGIATGNALEALGAAWALSRARGFDPALRRMWDAVSFILVVIFASAVIGAALGVAFLCLSALQPWSNFGTLWWHWTLGDAIGALVVAPAILATVHSRSRLPRQQAIEIALLVLLVVAVTEIVFGEALARPLSTHPLEFVVFPLVITAAVQWGQPATSLVVLAVSSVTISNTLQGIGPFTSGLLHQNLVLLQVLMGVVSSTGLILAAAITERQTADQRKAAAHAVGEVLSTSSGIEHAAPRILEAVCVNLDWRVGAFWTLDHDLQQLRCLSVWSRPDDAAAFTSATREMTFAPNVGLPGRVWASGQPAWIEDVVVDTNFPRASRARAAELHGAFGFPIRLAGDIYGVAEFFHGAVVTPDADLLVTMSSVGHQIGQFIARNRLEQAVRRSEMRTRAIVETAPDAIIGMDHRGVITEFNAAAERTFGHRREQIIGRELAEVLIPPRLRDAHRRGVEQFLHTGKGPFIDQRIETMAMHADGHEFPAELSITAVPTAGAALFTGFVRDVTERVRAETERRQLLAGERAARQEAEEANRAKDEFLATLSHELRTPLNAIVGWTRMLLDGTVEAANSRRALEAIDRNAQAQVQLVADLLDVSRIITGRLTLDVRPVDLRSIIISSMDVVRPAADARAIALRPTMPGAPLLTIGDPIRLQQVVWNLLSNAVKFTPQGGQVKVDLIESPASVFIRVEDSGPGIAAEFLPHVFERFRQADGSSTRRHGGLGLGLAIVRHLVELHGGSVRADGGGDGRGATFSVELPKSERPEGRSSAGSPDLAADARALPAPPSLANCRVLVVDDEADALELAETVLSRAGAEVRTARSVAEALASLEGGWPDVLLSDLGLPEEDGYALIRKIRALEIARDTRLPAAAITAYGRAEDRHRAVQEGFDLHLAKPAEPAAIVQAVRTLRKLAAERQPHGQG
jgi:PAS domain S-box-containing protein